MGPLPPNRKAPSSSPFSKEFLRPAGQHRAEALNFENLPPPFEKLMQTFVYTYTNPYIAIVWV